MPRKLTSTMTLDTIEDDILFSRATLRADPDTPDLLATTDGWLGLVAAVRDRERAVREQVASVDAERQVANARLDRVCERFGDALFLAVEKDRTSARFRSFFHVPVSRFVRLALSTQLERVKAWLGSADPALAPFKVDLETWSTRASDALVKTRALALVRGELATAREELAEDLTRERDGLHAALVLRAAERGLGRGWADGFFRVTQSSAPATPSGPDSPDEQEPIPR
jgi:hypothetical protein